MNEIAGHVDVETTIATYGELLPARPTSASAPTLADALLGELPLSDDGTGHVADCGYTHEDPTCDCYTLRGRLESKALAWFAARLDDPDMSARIAQACGDPGSIVPRNGIEEPISRWGGRAALAEVKRQLGITT